MKCMNCAQDYKVVYASTGRVSYQFSWHMDPSNGSELCHTLELLTMISITINNLRMK